MRVRVYKSLEIRKDQVDEAALRKLREAFTYKNPEFQKRSRMGLWIGDTPKTVSHFEEDEETFHAPRGATEKVKEILGSVKWIDSRVLAPHEFKVRKDRAEAITFRPDQEEVIQAILLRQNCLIRAATGSGKTECLLEAARRAGQWTLIIVWSSGLLRQWISRVRKRWGLKANEVGQIGGGKRIVRPITIAMQQSLYRSVDDLVGVFGFVGADEVQRTSARTHREVISQFPAMYRVGASADERRKDGLEVMTRDLFGKVAANITKEDLIEGGHICEVEIVVIPTDIRIAELDEAEERDREEGEGSDERTKLLQSNWVPIERRISEDEERNALVARLAADAVREGNSTLIFLNFTDHARAISRAVSIDEGVPCGLCLGGVENKVVFEETVGRLDKGALKVAAATSCMYQAQDIPRLKVGVVGTPLAGNQFQFEQVVGRLRRKFPGYTKGRLYYVWDRNVYRSHFQNLVRWYGRRLVTLVER